MKSKAALHPIMMIGTMIATMISCTPAEVAIAEELTEEAVVVEKDLFGPKMQPQQTQPWSDASPPTAIKGPHSHQNYRSRREHETIRGEHRPPRQSQGNYGP